MFYLNVMNKTQMLISITAGLPRPNFIQSSMGQCYTHAVYIHEENEQTRTFNHFKSSLVESNFKSHREYCRREYCPLEFI